MLRQKIQLGRIKQQPVGLQGKTITPAIFFQQKPNQVEIQQGLATGQLHQSPARSPVQQLQGLAGDFLCHMDAAAMGRGIAI
ncbi:hypothetical protein AAU61_17130 [Desulfocarbo indianensis]|nr:hypothetical protein AAU61_17130 [Desulfocarbo indianensis]